MKNNKVLLVGIVVVVVVVAGIVIMMSDNKTSTKSTSSTQSSSTAPTNAVATDSVTIKDYMFSPMAIKVKVGTTVTWTNQDEVHHSIIDNSNSPDGPKSPLIGKGETYKFTFKKAGTYTYHCDPHPYMHGIVQVTN